MMLAFELSTRRGSLVLHDGERVVAEERWDDAAARHAALYAALPRLLRAAGANWSRLTSLAAGRGPGSFSGIRVALTAAQGIALPAHLPVVAVSSGEALALAAMADPAHAAARTIVVAGDARRGILWYGVFHRHGHGVRQDGAWAVTPAADFPARVPDGAQVVTSDWARIAVDAAARWRREDRFPDATRVAELAWARLRDGIPGDPPEPLYLHPPV